MVQDGISSFGYSQQYRVNMNCKGDVDLESSISNDQTYANEWANIFERYISCFEWSNLPEGVDARQLEYWLALYGVVAFVYDEDLKGSEKAKEGYAVVRMVPKAPLDIYGLPKDIDCYTVDNDLPHLNPDKGNWVLIFDRQSRFSAAQRMDYMAARLADVQRTIDVNVAQQKTPKIIKCNDKTRLSFVNLFYRIKHFAFNVFASDKLDLSQVDTLDTTAPSVFNDLKVLYNKYENDTLTFAGIENSNTDKKERMITDEVLSNMGAVEAARFIRLAPRQQGRDLINKLLEEHGYFNVEGNEPVDVDFRSGVYIRTDKEGTVPTSGMQGDGPLDNAGYQQPSDSRIVEQIRSIIGGGE